MNPDELKTIKWYDDQALEWAKKHGLHEPKALFQPEMDHIFELKPTGKVLEVGTGHGGDAQKLIAHYGLTHYLGLDASTGLLEIARSRNPGAQLKHLSIYDLDFNQEFDVFWVSAMLIHLPKQNLHPALIKLHSALKHQGVGFISIMEGDADLQESRPGRHYSLWSQSEFEHELTRAGFEIIHFRKIVEPDRAPWLTYLIKRVILK